MQQIPTATTEASAPSQLLPHSAHVDGTVRGESCVIIVALTYTHSSGDCVTKQVHDWYTFAIHAQAIDNRRAAEATDRVSVVSIGALIELEHSIVILTGLHEK